MKRRFVALSGSCVLLAAGAAAQTTPTAWTAPSAEQVNAIYPEVEALYLDLHRNPELSLHEQQTAAKLAARMKALGYDVTTGVGGTGVVAVLRNGQGPTHRDMRLRWASTLLTAAAISSAQTARFGVDGVTTTPSTIVATIQPRTAAPGYSWLRIYFYSSPFTTGERANATKGDVESIRTAWAAVLQLTVDKNRTVWQIDLSLPGHTCTIAASDRDARNALQEFQFDGSRLRLKGKGSHGCDTTSPGIPRQRFEWDVDFETSVIKRGPGPR